MLTASTSRLIHATTLQFPVSAAFSRTPLIYRSTSVSSEHHMVLLNSSRVNLKLPSSNSRNDDLVFTEWLGSWLTVFTKKKTYVGRRHKSACVHFPRRRVDAIEVNSPYGSKKRHPVRGEATTRRKLVYLRYFSVLGKKIVLDSNTIFRETLTSYFYKMFIAKWYIYFFTKNIFQDNSYVFVFSNSTT